MDLEAERLLSRKQVAAHFGFANARSFGRWCKEVGFPEPDFSAGTTRRWTARLVIWWQHRQMTEPPKPGVKDKK